jgi:polyisoprenoid-binding protein YceI
MSTSGAASALTRTLDGQAVPTAGSFALDPAHSHVGFSVRHMMIAKVRGRFTGVSGRLEVADDPAESTVEIDVDVSSIDTREEQRDGHLRSPDFFDVETYPKMTFRGTGISPAGEGRFELEGELTVRDVTRPLTLDVSYNGVGQDPWGNQRVGFDASGDVNREDFGLTWNQALETGGVLVGQQAKIEIEAEFVRQ